MKFIPKKKESSEDSKKLDREKPDATKKLQKDLLVKFDCISEAQKELKKM